MHGKKVVSLYEHEVVAEEGKLLQNLLYVHQPLPGFRHLQHRTWQRDCKTQDRRVNCAFAPLECMLTRSDSKMVLCREGPFDRLRTFFKKLFT